MTQATIGTRLDSGGFHNTTIPDRTTSRHAWARKIEVGDRADSHDLMPHPYQNWGFSHELEYRLARLREMRNGR